MAEMLVAWDLFDQSISLLAKDQFAWIAFTFLELFHKEVLPSLNSSNTT